jgi:hypothetical protein
MTTKIFRCTLHLTLVVSLLGTWSLAQDATRQAPAPPKYCKPCLFYGGDFDANTSGADALLNVKSSSADGEVYVPFTVPQQQQWNVTGLFVNLLNAQSTTVPSKVSWSIRKSVGAGKGGTVVASGTASSTFGGQFNCGGIAVLCFGLVMKGIKVSLPPGRYWLSVVPQCKGASCDGQGYFLADVEDRPPLNHVGPLEPWDDSFFSSTVLGKHFAPTWGSSGVCGASGECDRFSAGVLGTK